MAAFVRGAALLDVPTGDPQWLDRSAGQRDACATGAGLCINPTVHAEASGGFERIGELDDALPSDIVTRLDLPWEAAC